VHERSPRDLVWQVAVALAAVDVTADLARRLFLFVLAVALISAALILCHVDPAIYRARGRIQPGTKPWDRILLAILLLAVRAILPVAALDHG
jgi:hypothetical protein